MSRLGRNVMLGIGGAIAALAVTVGRGEHKAVPGNVGAAEMTAGSGAAPHQCAFVNAPLANDQVRLDCPEHELAAEVTRTELWKQFLRPA